MRYTTCLTVCLLLTACSGSPQAREAKYMQRGNQYLAAKAYKEAIIEFKVASQNMPKDPEPVYRLGMAYLLQGAPDRAAAAFIKALTLNPKHEGALFQLASMKVGSYQLGLVEEAKQVLDPFVKTHPGDTDAMGNLALAEAKLGNKARAIELIGQASEKNPANLRAAGMVIALFAAKGDTATANAIARNLTDRLPDSPDAAVLRAQAALANEDTADADAQIGRALALKRDFLPALQLRLRRELMEQNNAGAEETTRELSKLSQKQTWATYARLLFGEGKVDLGSEEYKRVLKERGDDPELRDEYSSLLIGAGRDAEAAAVIAGTLEKSPKDRAALLLRTKIEINAGDLNSAARDVKTLHDMKVFSADLTWQESRILGARGETVKQGDMLANALKADPRLLNARLDLARVLVNAGQPQTALQTLAQASPSDKQKPAYAYYRIMALIAAGDYDPARKELDTALALRRSPELLHQDAVLRMKNHDLAGAQKSLESAFELAPGNPDLVNLLGEVMTQRNQGQQYLALIKDAIAKNPKSPLLQISLGDQLASQGDPNGARAAFEAAKAAGGVVEADEKIAFLDLNRGALDPARQRLMELVKTHDSFSAQFMLAEIEDRKGSPPDVVAVHYLSALKLQPASVPAMNNLAFLLASRQNKYEDALFWGLKALALAPENPEVEDTVGWIYYKQGKFDAALPHFQKSLKALERPLIHYHLAGALIGTGDAAGGRKEYELATKLDPNSPFRSEVAPLFETRGSR